MTKNSDGPRTFLFALSITLEVHFMNVLYLLILSFSNHYVQYLHSAPNSPLDLNSLQSVVGWAPRVSQSHFLFHLQGFMCYFRAIIDTFPEQHRNFKIFTVSLFSKFTLQICFYINSYLKKIKYLLSSLQESFTIPVHNSQVAFALLHKKPYSN